MTVGDCFAGIGGISLGLERAGFTVRWQIEIDPYARGVLEHHWPHVSRWGDIRLVSPDMLDDVECLAGGFPCQPVSVAGRRRGHADARWLWPEMFRLVVAKRPRWVLAENVPGLRTLGADRILGDLAGAGYTCWPLVVGARHVGAPHRRDRVWIAARLEHAPGLGLEGRRNRHARQASGAWRWPARPGEAQHPWEPPRTDQPTLDGRVDGLPLRLALTALGNAVVPQVVEAIGLAILTADQSADPSAL